MLKKKEYLFLALLQRYGKMGLIKDENHLTLYISVMSADKYIKETRDKNG